MTAEKGKGITRVQALIVLAVIVVAAIAGGYYYNLSTAPGATTRSTTATASSVSGPTSVKIGAVVPLTGGNAGFGTDYGETYKLAVDTFNAQGGIYANSLGAKVKIEMVGPLDDQTNPAVGASLVERLITQDKVVAILGTGGSGSILAQIPIAEKYHVPYVQPGGAIDQLTTSGYKYEFDTFFTLSIADEQCFQMLQSLLPSGRPKTLGIWASNSPTGLGQVQPLAALAKKYGYTVVYNYTYQPSTTDYSPMILGAKQANPDFLYESGGVTAEGVAIRRQMQTLGYSPPFYFDPTGAQDSQYGKNLGQLSDYVVFPTNYSPLLTFPGNAEFVAAWKNKMGYPPAGSAGGGYMTAQVLFNAIATAKSLTPDDIRDALAATQMNTIVGPVNFNVPGHQGRINAPVVFIQWQSGAGQVVWPKEGATAKFWYPEPSWDKWAPPTSLIGPINFAMMVQWQEGIQPDPR
jgi:branched-chain amino acid transport system substrate-binding protein